VSQVSGQATKNQPYRRAAIAGSSSNDRQTAPNAPLQPQTAFLTVGEVAARYLTGRQRSHRGIRKGNAVVRVGRLVRVCANSLADFEKRHPVTGRNG